MGEQAGYINQTLIVTKQKRKTQKNPYKRVLCSEYRDWERDDYTGLGS